MPCLPLARALALTLVAVSSAPARADSIRCAGGIVSTGDSKIDLLGKCGPPALTDARLAERSRSTLVGGTAAYGRRLVTAVETWTYDFGRTQFVQTVTLVKGKVASVERGGYGYADTQAERERSRKATCDAALIRPGDLKLDVLARCGDPAMVDEWQEERVARHVEGAVVTEDTAVTIVELWTYDFGPNRLLRFVRFADGKVVAVDTGSYGYAQ